MKRRIDFSGETDMDTLAERWLPVPGFGEYYEVSDQGRVRSLDRVVRRVTGHKPFVREGRLMKLSTHPAGYKFLNLSVLGTYHVRRVHVLVMASFVGPRPDGMVIRHLNGDPADNRLDNLTYGTQSENNLDTVSHGRHKDASKTHCIHGHTLPPPGVDGHRRCGVCHNNRTRRYETRMRLERKEGA